MNMIGRGMNKSRLKALQALSDAPLDSTGLIVQGLRRKTLHALCYSGHAKYRPYGKPPTWVITDKGREYLNK